MRKNFAAGIFAVGLIVAGGTGAYVAYAKDNTKDTTAMMQKFGMNHETMIKMMNSTDGEKMIQLMESKGSSFEDMLPYMKKMHPDLSDEQLKSLYENMHGKDGACSKMMEGGMMGKTSNVLQ